MKAGKTFIIALGGSIIVPGSGEININFLKKFRKFILKFIKEGNRFIIIAGGGKIARSYQKAASKIVKIPYEDMDWLGIHATRINAHLLRTIFRDKACPVVIDNPLKPLICKKDIEKYQLFIASGWRPGWSTDYIAVLLAKKFQTKEIIDAGNIPFVFDRDFQKYKNASPIKKISWKNYRKLIGPRWIPGLPSPIDPIAAKLAQKLKLKILVILGTDLENFAKVLREEKFRGTIIE